MSSIIARIPEAAYVGKTPTSPVEIPEISSVYKSILFLPILSPKCPKKTAPTGLMKNPIANMNNVSAIVAIGFPFGKKAWAINTAPELKRINSVPFQYSSYHGCR
jgi:hypothetical protein